MTTSLKTILPTAFTASSRHDPRYNRKEALDEAVTGFSESLIYFASPDLFPGQNSTFGNVANAVSGKGVNAFSAGGGASPTFTSGAMRFASDAAGSTGLKIGAAATASVKHVSDLTSLGAEEHPFFAVTFKMIAASTDTFVRPIYALSDSGTSPGGRLQFMLAILQTGLRIAVAGQSVDVGFIPTTGKIYTVGVEVIPNAVGTSMAIIWVYNVSDDVMAVEASPVPVAYAAWEAMVNGGAMLNRAYAITGVATLVSAAIYRALQGVVSTTSVSPRTADEMFYLEARLMREAAVTAQIA